MKKLLILSSVLFTFLFNVAAQNIADSFWETNGQVNTTLKSGNKIYVGGEFTYIGPSTGSLGSFYLSQSQVINAGLKISGVVNAMVKDNSGNIYLGGNFSINGGTSKSVIKLSQSLVPDASFQHTFNGTVSNLAINNNCLFASGQFSLVDGQARYGLAGIELATNLISTFAPNPDGQVNTLATGDGNLYVGGNFAIISGSARNAIAAYNSSKTLLPLSLNVHGSISTLGLKDSLLFIGGAFDSIGGMPRKNLASMNTSTNLIRLWRADLTGTVADMAFSGNNLYVAGNFYQVGIASRNHIAAINVLTNAVQSFDPGFDAEVKTIRIIGSTIYAGGSFTSEGFDTKSHLAGIKLSDGTLSGNLPELNDDVLCLMNIGDTLISGGVFSSFGGVNRFNFAVLNANTGAPLPMTMDVSGPITDLEMVGSDLLLAGSFNFVNSTIRNGVAIIDTATGIPNSWNAQCDGFVRDALVFGNTIYLAGEFTQLGTTTRKYLALVDASTAALASWNPNPNKPVSKLLLNQAQLYAIGDFNLIGATSRNHIASFNLSSSGSLRLWNTVVDSTINTIATNGAGIFIGGMFTHCNGLSRNYLAAVDTGAGNIKTWAPQVNAEVKSILEDNGVLYAGGKFSSSLASGFSTFNTVSAAEIDFPVKIKSGMVSSMKLIGTQLFISGNFAMPNGKSNFAMINLATATPTVQASALTFSSVSPSGMKLKYNRGNGTMYLVLAKQGSAVDTFPSNGMNLTANNMFGSGQSLGNNFVVYNGTDTTFDVTGLNALTNYHFAVFTYNGFSNNTNYLQTNPARGNQTTIIGYNPPTVAASNILFSGITTSQMMIKWTKGNGSGRYVVVKEASAVSKTPLDSFNYLSNSNFGSGDDLGSGNFIVVNNNADSVLVNGLKPGTTYHVKIYEYNGIVQYRRVMSTGSIANAATLAFAAEPTSGSGNIVFSNVTSNSMQLNWTNGNGTGRIVIASKGQPVSTLGVDGESYFTDNSFNGLSSFLSNNERVVYVGTGNQFVLTGLEPLITYHFAILEFNGTGLTINYQSTGYATGNKKTLTNLVYPTIASKDITFTKVGRDSLQFSWTPGNGDQRLVLIRKSNPVTGLPVEGKTYIANTKFGLGDSLSDGSFVVLSGTANSVLVTGLISKTVYHIAVFDHNNSVNGQLYYTDSFAIANTTTLPPTGLMKIKRTGSIKVYPNPVCEGSLFMEFEKPVSVGAQAMLFDLNGKLILDTHLEQNIPGTYSINLEKVSSGDYLVKIFADNETYQSRIRIQ